MSTDDFAALEHATPIVQGHELHLYVVEFIGHGVKVGVSDKPDKRIAQHHRDAAAFGRQVGRVWLSGPHVEARSNERALKKLAGAAGRREYLPLEFEPVVEHAETLPKSRVTAATVNAQRARTEALFDSILGGLGK